MHSMNPEIFGSKPCLTTKQTKGMQKYFVRDHEKMSLVLNSLNKKVLLIISDRKRF